jgi:hypothetical protein
MSRLSRAAAALAAALTVPLLGAAPPAAAAPAPGGAATAAVAAHFVLAGFGSDQGWRNDRHHRFLGDITGDGRADVVGLGDDGVATAVATGDGGFAAARFVLREFGVNQGWSVDRHPRFLTDVTADGLADLVGIGPDGTVTAIARGDGTFLPPQTGGPFGAASVPAGSRVFVPDLNADGRSDLAVVGATGVRTARSLGTGLFSPATTASTAYDLVRFDPGHYRVTDVTGDRRAEVLALQVDGPVRMVSSVPVLDGFGTFADPRPAGADFPPGLPAPSVTLGAVTDVTGDGRADLVAFGESVSGTWVAAALGGGGFGAYRPATPGFGPEGGWTAARHPRLAGELTGPDAAGVRMADLVGFGDEGVWTAVATGDGAFSPPAYTLAGFGYDEGWRVERHVRLLADITGDGLDDVVGFGDAGVWTAVSRGDGTFVASAGRVVPDLRGLARTEAAAALAAAGLVVGRTGYVLDPTCASVGRVLRQSPAAGAEVAPGSAVDVSVGLARPGSC